MIRRMFIMQGVIALIITALGLTASLPALANNAQDRSFRGGASINIIVRDREDQDDLRAFQHYFQGQMRGYDRIDPVTGERLSNLLQLVEENRGTSLIVSNQQERRRIIDLNPRTRITLEDSRPAWLPPGFQHRARPGDVRGGANRIQPGDLIVAEGYLTAAGRFVGTHIRVVGQAWGWDDDRGHATYEGFRAWGDVRNIDTRRNEVEIRTNSGTLLVTLARNGVLLYKGREYRIQNLERGDRVIFYHMREHHRTIEAYRIVVLESKDRYPQGSAPHWADPDFDSRGRDGLWTEGRLEAVSTGIFMNRVTLRIDQGRTMTFHLTKSMTVIDEDGDRIPLRSLRQGELIRIYYSTIDGTHFASLIMAR